MSRKAPAPLVNSLLLVCSVAVASPPSALERFVADSEFCAYMVSVPDGESEVLLRRYEAALEAAVASLRQNTPLSRSRALFAIRARCDAVLAQANDP